MAISKLTLHKGSTMIEVMVTLLIVLIGLLGIAALQIRAQASEFEAYQRAQALIIMSDIVDKLNVNRSTTSCFAITTNTTAGTPFVGTGGITPTCTASTAAYNNQAIATMTLLNNKLSGVEETLTGADITNVGAITGARACISYDSTTIVNGVPGTGLFTIIVTWQGMGNLLIPTNMNCAVGLYGSEASRRAVSTTVRIANLVL